MGDIEKQRKEHLEWAVSKGLYEFQVQGVVVVASDACWVTIAA